MTILANIFIFANFLENSQTFFYPALSNQTEGNANKIKQKQH